MLTVSPWFLYVLEASALVRLRKEVYPRRSNVAANAPLPNDDTTTKSIVDIRGGYLGFEGRARNAHGCRQRYLDRYR